MAKRLKRVVEPGMVAHLWAHRTQDDARNARGNIYFLGDTIYSYGNHFPIARHVENSKGERAVLFTTETYSSTTAGHIWATRGACRHLVVFNVPHPRNDGPQARREDFADYRKRQLDAMQQYTKARSTKPRILERIGAIVAEANAFAKFFGIRQRLTMPAAAEEMAAECDRITNAEHDRTRRAEAKRLRKAKEKLAEWVAGEPMPRWDMGGFNELPVRLRIDDDNLETSMGAVVSKAEAIRVFRILRKLRKRAKTYKANGETIKLGPFALDSMDENGVVQVGCHTVEWAEIERVAKLAGVK